MLSDLAFPKLAIVDDNEPLGTWRLHDSDLLPLCHQLDVPSARRTHPTRLLGCPLPSRGLTVQIQSWALHFGGCEYQRAGELFDEALDASRAAASKREIAWNLGVMAANQI